MERIVNLIQWSTFILYFILYIIQVLVEHDNLVSCAAITNDNSYVLSGSYDRRLLVWGLSTGAVEQQLLGHTLPVTCVKVTDDSTVAISGQRVQLCQFFQLFIKAVRCYVVLNLFLHII